MKKLILGIAVLLFSCQWSSDTVILLDPVGAELAGFLPSAWNTSIEVISPENLTVEVADQYSQRFEKVVVSRWLYAYSPASFVMKGSDAFLSLDDKESTRSLNYLFNLDNLNDFLPYYTTIAVVKKTDEQFLGTVPQGVTIIDELEYSSNTYDNEDTLLVVPTAMQVYDAVQREFKADILISNGILFYKDVPQVIGSIYRDLTKITPFIKDNPFGGELELSIELRPEGKRFDKELTRKYNSN